LSCPNAGALAFVKGAQVAVLGADRGHRGILERGVQPARSFAGASGALLAGRAIVARALPGPGRQVPRRWEHGHVRADLGDDDLGGAPSNAGDRAQQLNGAFERGDLFLDGVREPVD